jgi:hypothetical protein
MKRLKILVAAAALAAAAAGAASAEIALEGVHWQVGRVEGARVTAWQDVKVLLDGPPRLDNRLRARLVLKNRGMKEEDGLLLRYSLTARVAPAEGAEMDGSWAIPFTVDEKRVPKVGADKMLEVPLDAGPALDLYLRRLARSGWWPDRIKIQVMLEPRAGIKTIEIVEDVLEVRREAKP